MSTAGERREFSNGEVTVVWQPTKCVHSANCVRGLPAVFDPKARPWIRLEGAATAEIIQVVERCPSGALTYYRDADGPPAVSDDAAEVTRIEVRPHGPLLVHGSVAVEHADGRRERYDRVVALCRCGRSANKPFCDGAHSAGGFRDPAE